LPFYVGYSSLLSGLVLSTMGAQDLEPLR